LIQCPAGSVGERSIENQEREKLTGDGKGHVGGSLIPYLNWGGINFYSKNWRKLNTSPPVAREGEVTWKGEKRT